MAVIEDASRRRQMLDFFRHDFGVLAKADSLRLATLPPLTARFVDEIAAAKSAPRDLVLLGLLAAIAAADRGHSRVVTSNGDSNTLSLLIHVGAESGCGKSRSLEVPLAILDDWEQKKQREVAEENEKRKVANRVTEEQLKRLTAKFTRGSGDVTLEDIQKLTAAKFKLLPKPQIFLNDVTAAAYAQQLVNCGYAVRLESDGTPLPKAAMRQVTKAWSGETSSRTRVYAPDGVIRDPFIVDAVFTQPAFFNQHINNREYLESGLMARTLPYRYEDEMYISSINSYSYQFDEEFHTKLRSKLCELLEASEYDENDEREYRIINVAPNAEELLAHCNQKWRADAAYGHKLYRVREFVARMPQHALRLAGCLYLIEYPVDSFIPISISLMKTAIEMVEIFLSHVLRWTIKNYEDLNVECCRAIMIYVLENNSKLVSEKEIKLNVPHKFKTADIDIALEYLLLDSYLYIYEPLRHRYRSRVGRPTGRTFENPYYDPDEAPF